MAAHRYWRVFFTAVNGSTIVGLTEVEFRATPGGADQTGVGFGTAISGGDFGGAFLKANAYDNTAAEWASPFPSIPGAWIGWDRGLGFTMSVQEVALTNRSTGGADNQAQAPRTFAIQWSDDAVTWTTVWDLLNETSWGNGETRVYSDPVPAGSVGATKKQTYAVLGPPLLLTCTKKVMYVITGPGYPRYKVRLIKSAPVGAA